jgi:hypothetical protein
MEAGRLRLRRFAERLDRNLEVQDPAPLGANRNRRRGCDHPLVGVGGDVRRHLVHLAGGQAERRPDERVGPLVNGQVSSRRWPAPVQPCDLLSVRGDEARLHDGSAVCGADRAESNVDVANRRRLRRDRPVQRSGRCDGRPPDRAPGAHEDERALACEIAREHPCLARGHGAHARSLVAPRRLVRRADQEHRAQPSGTRPATITRMIHWGWSRTRARSVCRSRAAAISGWSEAGPRS